MPLAAARAVAQSITVEADLSAGVSTENVRAAAVQARVFGASASDWRFFAEATFGGTDGQPSDAFSSAYPYDGRLRPMEIYGEKMFRPRNHLLGVRGGRYRTPFGISSRGDHAYTGFTRAPLVRYGQFFALSNTAMEGGGSVVAGSPRLYAETSLGVPLDEGNQQRRQELSASVRVQGYYKSLIAGASHLDTGRDKSLGSFASGRAVFSGVDARWSGGGVQVRGEWIFGHPFEGVDTSGGYIDLIVHRVGMGPLTAAVRAERLDYTALVATRSLYLASVHRGRPCPPGLVPERSGQRHSSAGGAGGRAHDRARRRPHVHGPPVTRQATPPPRAATFIPWHDRLEARVLIAVSLIAGVSLSAALYAAGRVVENYSLQRSADDLQAAKVAFDRLVERRARFAAAQTRLIAELPVFRAHMDPTSLVAGDAATISAMAEDYRRKLAADFCLVTDARGRLIGDRAGAPLPPGMPIGEVIDSARGGRSAYDIVPSDEHLYLVVAEPALFADEVLGTITAGYKLDDRVAEELASVTLCEVSFVCARDRLCASSLPAAQRADLTSVLVSDRAAARRRGLGSLVEPHRPGTLRQRRLPAAAEPRRRGSWCC